MKLTPDRFMKGCFNFRREANGPVESVPRYSYETAHDLYDVIVFAETDRPCTAYRLNGYDSPYTRIHAAIERHYDLRLL